MQKKPGRARIFYRLMLAVIAAASVAFGSHGGMERELSSGKGSWARPPWRVEGDDAILLGLVFVIFGIYLLVVVIRNR